MSVAPSGPNWGNIFGGIAERVGEVGGGYIAGKIGQAIGGTPMSVGAGIAQEQINDQIKRIKKLTEELQERTEYYRTLGNEATKDLGKVSGITIPEYRTAAIDQFNRGVAAERGLGESYLKGYDPNILSSAAGGRFRSTLSSASEDYKRALGSLGSEGSQRFLTAATATPVAAFKAIANDRDYNLLLNPDFMSEATSPQTVSMDYSKYKPYMTYNV